MDPVAQLKAAVASSVGLLEARTLEQLRSAVEESGSVETWTALLEERTPRATAGASGIDATARRLGLRLNELCSKAVARVRDKGGRTDDAVWLSEHDAVVDAASLYTASKLRSLAAAELRAEFDAIRTKATQLADSSAESSGAADVALQAAADAVFKARRAVTAYAGVSESGSPMSGASLDSGISLSHAKKLTGRANIALKEAATALLDAASSAAAGSGGGDESDEDGGRSPASVAAGGDQPGAGGEERPAPARPTTHDVNIEQLRSRLMATAEALRHTRQRGRCDPRRVESAIGAVSGAGTALFEYQAANSLRGGAPSGTDVASFATRATRELLAAEAAVRALRRPAATARKPSRTRRGRDGGASSVSGMDPSLVTGSPAGSRRLADGPRATASASVISHHHDPEKIAQWARAGQYERIMAAARESTWSDLGIETGRRSVGRSSVVSARSSGGKTMVEAVRALKHAVARDRNARRATEARLASTGESRFQQRERDVGDPRTLHEAALGSEGLSTLRGTARLVDKFSLQAETEPSLFDGKDAWAGSAQGRQRSREAQALAYKSTFVKLGEAAGTTSGLDMGGAGGETSCRSGGLWAAAGVPVRPADVARSPRPAWGRRRDPVASDDEERWSDHPPVRARSTSRNRARAVAGIDAEAAAMRRALRAARLQKGTGGMFVGEAAEAFELLLAETLGETVTNEPALRASRGRDRLARHARSRSASRSRRGSRSSTPVRASAKSPVPTVRGPRSASGRAPRQPAASPMSADERRLARQQAWTSAFASPVRAPARRQQGTELDRVRSLVELAGSSVSAIRASGLPDPSQ